MGTSFTYERYTSGWCAYSPLWDEWDDEKAFPTKEAAEEAVERFLLTQTEEGLRHLRERDKRTYWERARCTNTYRKESDRAKDQFRKYGHRLVKVRRYKDPLTEEVRKTIEIEVPTI